MIEFEWGFGPYWSVDKNSNYSNQRILRIIRIIRIDEILNSHFSKYWKPQNSYFAFYSDFQNFFMKSEWWNGDLRKIMEPGIEPQIARQETPNKPLDDASNICESSNTCTISEFLMIILRKFCDGTTFHHLWDHKILFKRDDWILHVS